MGWEPALWAFEPQLIQTQIVVKSRVQSPLSAGGTHGHSNACSLFGQCQGNSYRALTSLDAPLGSHWLGQQTWVQPACLPTEARQPWGLGPQAADKHQARCASQLGALV